MLGSRNVAILLLIDTFVLKSKIMTAKPLILVTNDDGMFAPGIKALVEVAKEFGDVIVVAPDSPQSAMGHAITINSTLHCNQMKNVVGPQKEYQSSLHIRKESLIRLLRYLTQIDILDLLVV